MKLINRIKYIKRKDIMFVLTQDLESPSGLGRYFPLAKNLSKQGLSVSIATLHSNYDSLKQHQFIKEGIHVAYVAQMHVKKENNTTKYFTPQALLWISLRATLKLIKYVVQNPANIIVIGKPHPMNSIAGLIGGHLVGAKIILDCDDYEAASNYFSSIWQRRIVKIFENWMPKLVHHITTNTFFNKERMMKLGVPEEKIGYIPNGIDKERFSAINKQKTQNIATRLNLENQKVLAYIGSISLANHPIDLLMHAFKLVKHKLGNVKFLIVGGGKDHEKLKHLAYELDIDDDVIFVGRVSPNLVPYYYEIVDVSVDPVFDTDGARGRCPLKMFESWEMRTPFITADVGDRKILAGRPPAALITEPGDAISLAKEITSLLKNKEYQKILSDLGYNRVQEFYWQNITSNSLELFRIPDR